MVFYCYSVLIQFKKLYGYLYSTSLILDKFKVLNCARTILCRHSGTPCIFSDILQGDTFQLKFELHIDFFLAKPVQKGSFSDSFCTNC